MARPKYTIYKHVKLNGGWRYCRAAFHPNGKIKPDVVLINGVGETHREGAYYLYHDGQWISAGNKALDASTERQKRLNVAEYHRLHGTKPAEVVKANVGVSISVAIDAYLEELERKVQSRNRRPGTLQLMRTTLRKFSQHAKVHYLSEITVAHLDNYAAWCVATSRTHSPQTARNEFLRVLQFLKSRGVSLTKKDGEKQIPIGMNDAPKVSQKKNVITNTPEELERFFAACNSYKQSAAFQTLHRAGLREMELITLRPEDIVLETEHPYIDVCARVVNGYDFVPKWYAERRVDIDPELVSVLRRVKASCKGKLVFGTKGDKLNLHLLRECKRIAERAGLPPSRFKLHRFRANFATHCLREGMDLETLRSQMGHRDTESLRAYVEATKGGERAKRVAKVWSGQPLKMAASD
jgi:integrase